MNAVGADGFGGPLRGLCDSRAHPHPPRMRSAPSPWKGEGLWAAQCAAPTVGNGPGVLVRQTQAQKWSRTRSNFPQSQGPVARREFRHSLRFCAPEGFCLAKGVTPVIGVRGKATMSTKCSSGAVPGGKIPSAHNKRNPKPVPSSVTASPCHLPPRGKAYGRPLAACLIRLA